MSGVWGPQRVLTSSHWSLILCNVLRSLSLLCCDRGCECRAAGREGSRNQGDSRGGEVVRFSTYLKEEPSGLVGGATVKRGEETVVKMAPGSLLSKWEDGVCMFLLGFDNLDMSPRGALVP